MDVAGFGCVMAAKVAGVTLRGRLSTHTSPDAAWSSRAGDAFMSESWIEASQALKRGRLVIYPTETFTPWAQSGHSARSRGAGFHAQAAPPGQTPAAHPRRLGHGRAVRVSGVALALAGNSWPGPLSIVTQWRRASTPWPRDASGRSAVRARSSSPWLVPCARPPEALGVLSANRSGQPPAAS